ncbi:hypothetical protein ABLN97_11795 [Mycobacterium tuberculosis]
MARLITTIGQDLRVITTLAKEVVVVLSTTCRCSESTYPIINPAPMDLIAGGELAAA